MLKMDQLLYTATEPLSLISSEEKEEIVVKLIRLTNAINLQKSMRDTESQIHDK